MRPFLFLLMLSVVTVSARAEDPVLQNYIRAGLESNRALQQAQISYLQQLQALREARGRFLPAIGIEARYSRAGGGRTFDIPVGDLFNPLHATLNHLLQQPAFPTDLENVSIPFLREEEHDTRLRLVQPVFQPGLLHNHQSKKHLAAVQRAARDAFARALVAEIKQAYFTYLKSEEIVKLLAQTDTLLRENLRVSESFYRNDLVTEDAVLRAKAELSELRQEQAVAEKNRVLAAAFFNFLLNRELDTPIETAWTEVRDAPVLPDVAVAEKLALDRREEILQLQAAIRAAQSGVGAAQSAYLPGITAVVDYGFQGEKYRFGSEDDYWMASLVLSWNLFNGFQDQARVAQAKLEKKRREAQFAELQQQIALQVREAYHGVVVAAQVKVAAAERVLSMRKSFQIVARKYREGMSPQIEFLDARNSLTRAEIAAIISRYDYEIALAAWERVTGAYPLQSSDMK